MALSICGYEKSLPETQNQLNTPYSIKILLRTKKNFKNERFYETDNLFGTDITKKIYLVYYMNVQLIL